MFALRPSVLRSPALFSRFSSGFPSAPPSSLANFLADDNAGAPGGPTPFEEELPPTPLPDGYAPPRSFSHAAMTRQSSSPRYRLHCHSSRNNTIVTFTKPDGSTIAWLSGGSTPSKFTKGNRASYEAGYQCAVGIFKRIVDHNRDIEPIALDLFFKGFGEGRTAMKTALLATEGEGIRKLISSITDRTPIKIGGTRSKKQRRG